MRTTGSMYFANPSWASGSAMARFEYATLKLTGQGPAARVYVLLPEGNRQFEVEAPGDRALLDALNALADDGWELVAVDSVLDYPTPSGNARRNVAAERGPTSKEKGVRRQRFSGGWRGVAIPPPTTLLQDGGGGRMVTRDRTRPPTTTEKMARADAQWGATARRHAMGLLPQHHLELASALDRLLVVHRTVTAGASVGPGVLRRARVRVPGRSAPGLCRLVSFGVLSHTPQRSGTRRG
jgi:hypothetical protein